eukprot:10511927-Alexandrium_andersonii.AAC.1
MPGVAGCLGGTATTIQPRYGQDERCLTEGDLGSAGRSGRFLAVEGTLSHWPNMPDTVDGI